MPLEKLSKRVLLLEDDRIMADVLQRSLSRAGLDAIRATSGLDACQNHLNEPFDIVVTDFQMPGMNGEEFVRRLRESPDHQDIPVIFITGKGFEIDTEALRQDLDIYEFLTKPFSPRHLIQTIQKCLGECPDAILRSVKS